MGRSKGRIRSPPLQERRTPITALCAESSVVTPTSTIIRGAVYQPPAPPSSSSATCNENNPFEILTQVADALRVASMSGVDIVVFPELFLTGGPNNCRGTMSASLDRECSELNVIGNLCGDLNVACVIGYAERNDETASNKNGNEINTCSDKMPSGIYYNSLAAYNADGSRAGNYQCCATTTSSDDEFKTGHPFVEVIPISIQVPIKRQQPEKETSSLQPKEVKVGIMCGNDLMVPESSRHLVRCGAQLLLVSAALDKQRVKVAEHVVVTRAIENETPLLFANYVDRTSNDDFGYGNPKDEEVSSLLSLIGSSAIIAQDGTDLVRAPQNEFDDMPNDTGYLLPCEAGALYAANIEIFNHVDNSIAVGSDTDDAKLHQSHRMLHNSIKQWDLNPRIDMGREVVTASNNGGDNRAADGTKKHLGFAGDLPTGSSRRRNLGTRRKRGK